MSLTVPTVTGYSGFWANILVPSQGPGTYSMSASQVRSSSSKFISREVRGGGTRDVRGALAALIGAAAGGAALNQYRRRQGPAGPSETTPIATGFGDFGGNITIETVSPINRVTTAADVTELKKWFDATLLEAGITYPTVAGNNLAAGMQVGGTGRF